MAAAGPSLSPSPTPIALEQDHRTTAQGPDLWRDQLRRAGVDQQRRARPAEHVDRLSADVHRGLCADPVAGPPVRELRDPMPWTPYADWIFTVVSTGSLLLIAWLVLRPRP